MGVALGVLALAVVRAPAAVAVSAPQISWANLIAGANAPPGVAVDGRTSIGRGRCQLIYCSPPAANASSPTPTGVGARADCLGDGQKM